jgi:hypothetical protein
VAVGEVLTYNSARDALDWDIDGVSGQAAVTVHNTPGNNGGCTQADLNPIGSALGRNVGGSPSGALGLLQLSAMARVRWSRDKRRTPLSQTA